MVKTNWVRTGWFELHNAAMTFGAEIDYLPQDNPELKNRRYLDAELYTSLLSKVVKYSKIRLEIYDCRSELICNLIFRQIRKTARKRDDDLWKFLTTVDSIDVLINQFQQSAFFIQDAQSPSFSKIQIHTIAKYGAWLIYRETKTPQEYLSAILWGFALIGLTKHLWSQQGVCEFCYRRTWPGRRFCEEHSQSQSDAINRSKNYMNYRTGKKAHLLVKKHKLTERVQGSAMLKQAISETAMCDLLFPALIDEKAKNDEKELIYQALSQSPRVLRRFREQSKISYEEYVELKYDSLITHLRKTLDSYELSSLGWPSKILAAEIWFTAEIKVSPGVRKNGRKATARIAMAKKLFASGLTKSQIAAKLKISPSAISKWLVRKPEIKNEFGEIDEVIFLD